MPSASLVTLERRSALTGALRRFFAERGVLEVDVPVLQGGANLDPGIAPLRVSVPGSERWLPTSPEHPLKRLVAAYGRDVWALSPVFRSGELGWKHAPEFRMLEWYRVGWDDRRLQDEVIALLDALTGLGGGLELLSYRDAFRRWAGIDPALADDDALATVLGDDAQAVRLADGGLDRAAACDLILATRVERHLGRAGWTALTGFPLRIAAQARARQDPDGVQVAARFEVYRNGVELANGYHELTDGAELARRLAEEQRQRAEPPARDQRFEAAMASGLPECAGVAVGFDRVVMLALGLERLADSQAFAWERA